QQVQQEQWAKQKAEQQVQQEQWAKQKAEQQAKQFAAKLRELGINPDDIIL
ncbi:MAG: Uma2 family endonuclease, partial [Pseudoalteromonas sp.]|nr:Uma2 family endonuclease [Pseudoalteromonas sp.]